MNTNARLAQFRMQVAQALKSGATATGQTTRRVDPMFAPAPPPTDPGPMQAVLRSTLSRLNAQIVSARTSGPLYDLVDSYILTVAQLAATLPQSPAPPGSVLGASLSAVAGSSGSWRDVASAGGSDNPLKRGNPLGRP